MRQWTTAWPFPLSCCSGRDGPFHSTPVAPPTQLANVQDLNAQRPQLQVPTTLGSELAAVHGSPDSQNSPLSSQRNGKQALTTTRQASHKDEEDSHQHRAGWWIETPPLSPSHSPLTWGGEKGSGYSNPFSEESRVTLSSVWRVVDPLGKKPRELASEPCDRPTRPPCSLGASLGHATLGRGRNFSPPGAC